MRFDQYQTNAVMHSAQRPPLVFTEGSGMWLRDHEGKSHLDFVQGWAVNCLGHAPQCIRDALAEQAGKVINPSPAFHNAPSIELAALLTANSCFDRVFFASSGAEANEGAIKLARRWGKRNKGGAYEIITFDQAFHGRTLATMSASGKPGWDTLFAPQVRGFPKAILNDIASVEKLIGKETAAIMLEPVQGEAGVIPASSQFMRQLHELTRQRGILLIVDEVQTGMGRTGELFGYQRSGIEPDIMTLGKGIGGGVPLAALLCTEQVACFQPGDQGGTYSGNALMTAVGGAVLKQVLQPGFLQTVKDRGEFLRTGLLSLSKKHGLAGERGEGLLRALQLGKNLGTEIVEKARALEPAGLLLNSPRPDLLRFMPALNVSEEEIDCMLKMLSQVLHDVA